MSKLKGFQRKYLRSQAHHLDPVVMIGKNGLVESVLDKIDTSLDDHELIKIRFHDYERDVIKEMCEEISKKMSAEFCGKIGHVGIFFRQHDEPENRKIMLPGQ
ncbi:YhbY family RNA-binding protein [candidate division KSB1 bacterium]|nr:YhbY family RNA-binding protein [candidate division KSB1 bacterium]